MYWKMKVTESAYGGYRPVLSVKFDLRTVAQGGGLGTNGVLKLTMSNVQGNK